VPYHWGVGAAFFALMFLASFAMPVEWDGPLFNLVLCPTLSYLTVLIGLTRVIFDNSHSRFTTIKNRDETIAYSSAFDDG
jgi:hypothetical protein